MKLIKSMWIISIALIIINIIVYGFRLGGENFLTVFSDSLPVVCALLSVICLIYAVRSFEQFDFAKIAWIMILSGIFLDFVAESIYSVLEIGMKMDMDKNFPSFADYFWTSAYLFTFAGLAMMFVGYKKSGFPLGNVKRYLLLGFIVLALAITFVYFMLIPIVKDTETRSITKFFYLFYPIADLFVVIFAFILVNITSVFGSGKISRPWKFLAIGFIFFTLGDFTYSILGWKDLYGNGNFIDLAWHGGYLIIGLAGLYQKNLIESFKE